jgi:DNA-binding winged helix-turn-helix (wHTH) protein
MQFARFSLLERRRELLADGMQADIGSRALDVLIALIGHRGELVAEDEPLSSAARACPRAGGAVAGGAQ